MSKLMAQARNRVPRFAEAAVERARLTVVPQQDAPARRAPFVTLVLVLLAGGVVGLLMFNTHMQQASFYATSLQARATALSNEKQGLQMDIAALRSPQQLALAAHRLGMVAPPQPAFVRISDGRVLGQPLQATVGDRMRIIPRPASKPASLKPPAKIITVRPTQKPTQKGTQKGTSTTGKKSATGSASHGAASTTSGTATGKKKGTGAH